MMQTRNPQIIARKLLQNLNIKKIPINVRSIAEKSGLSVSEIELDSDIWAILEPGKKKIFIREQDHEHRKRFSIAHELGHYFMGHCNGIHIEKAYRDKKSIEGIYTIEIEANRFAAELLMPAEFIAKKMDKIIDGKDINMENLISELAEDFDVSNLAMENRLSNLGYIVLTNLETNE
jgi:Zn-dependent peptidase ImmA (M78 family)